MLKPTRALFNASNSFRVAVVGSGPAGFYTSYRLLDKLPNAKVDLYESLPVPYGLARFGVAPDHPEVKNCQEKFEEVAEGKNFRFVGNVHIGKDLDLAELKSHYNSVIFAYGSSEDNKLGVTGEDANGVFSARQFVGWYNGLPQFAGLNPPLEDAEDVVVVGNGNVALDVARILLCDVSRLKSTDITEEAYEVLKKSKVKNVRITARRGVLQSAFTTKEIRELIREPGVKMTPLEPEHIDPYRTFIPMLARKTKRLVQLIDSAAKENAAKQGDLTKSFSLDYLKSPTEFYQNARNPRLISSVEFELNSLIQDDITSPATVVGSGHKVLHKAELAFKSIGYKSIPIEGADQLGIPFDAKRGVIPNDLGRVVGETATGEMGPIPGLYTTGWVKTGPTGVIAETMRESFEVAETMVEDYYKDQIDKSPKPGFDGLRDKVKSRPVSWSDWKNIEKVENSQGEKLGKPRSKLLSSEEMLACLD